MKYSLVPDYMFRDIYEITPDFLAKNRISALLCDVDNTLSPYEDATPNGRVTEWIHNMNRHGIGIALISNNNKQRIDKYNEQLGLVAYCNAHKPSKKCYLQAVEKLGVSKEHCAVVGDQIFTDALSARLLGTICIVVPPIADKKTPFFKFKRLLEVPFIRKYYRREGKA